MTAEVLWWNVDRGHGFARAAEEDIFVHHSSIVDADGCSEWRGELNLRRGQTIEFDIVAGTVGTVAANVRVLA